MTDTAAPILVTTDAPGTAAITFHRPHRRNAWTVPMPKAYYDALEALRDGPEVRAIVAIGANGSLCPGADTDALTTYSDTGTTNPEAASIATPEWYPATYPKPLITAVEGMCAGVGLAQALMCDIRIRTPGARFTTAFTRVACLPCTGWRCCYPGWPAPRPPPTRCSPAAPSRVRTRLCPGAGPNCWAHHWPGH